MRTPISGAHRPCNSIDWMSYSAAPALATCVQGTHDQGSYGFMTGIKAGPPSRYPHPQCLESTTRRRRTCPSLSGPSSRISSAMPTTLSSRLIRTHPRETHCLAQMSIPSAFSSHGAYEIYWGKKGARLWPSFRQTLWSGPSFFWAELPLACVSPRSTAHIRPRNLSTILR